MWISVIRILFFAGGVLPSRRVRSDSVQSDHKSTQEEAEEEAESSLDKKLPGDWLVGAVAVILSAPDFKYLTNKRTKSKGHQEFVTKWHIRKWNKTFPSIKVIQEEKKQSSYSPISAFKVLLLHLQKLV